MEIRLLTQKAEMAPLYPLIRQLSPKVTEERYLFLLDDMLTRGYRMAAAYEGDTCVGLSGIWIGTKIYSGKYMELDNVVVSETHRSKGIGQLLCDFATALALEEGVEMMMLDAYRENHRAHAFYEREGFIRRGFHMLRPVSGWALEHPPVLPPELKD
ncbi:MAG: GNAT family N-acetyltransferase [Saprospiraceae bacterium]|nr:GNAT family N-acetyltransferase [Saprospiraceae bacterium]